MVVTDLQERITLAGGKVVKMGKGAFSADLSPQLAAHLRNHVYIDDVSIFNG